MKRRVIHIANFLITHYKGTYRIKAPYDINKNQFPRKLNGTFEDIDCYIDCQYGNKIFYYGRNILQAYIPSVIRGHNIIKTIKENFGLDIISNIEELDTEVLFKFHQKDADKIIPLLKPRTNGANISPFSSKNLPKNKDYKIPDEDLLKYKNIVQNVPKECILTITHITQSFIKSLSSKKNTMDDIKADMAIKGLKGKEYLYSIGRWNEYLEYLKTELSKQKGIIINEYC